MSPDDADRPSPDAPYATTEAGGTATANQDTLVPTPRGGKAIVLPEGGYVMGEVIGRGGMGEVVTAHDRRIGRDVAIKRMRSAAPSEAAIARFLREARIQGRLDHPAIVPVHELALDTDGRPYFTMKRLAGVTLAQRLADRGGQKPLLRAFVDVCLAIEFAHAHGIVHRDLKPANIMLGDYGEVYVLDWGIARVLADHQAAASPADAIDTLDEGTQAGELLGTPGFMAPEQIRGEDVGPLVDVYALGAILFEILTGESLHPRGAAAIASTLGAAQQFPASRAVTNAIAPELDAACHDALADLAAARPTARELGVRIQRYLDGDRDVEQRRGLAAAQLELARAALGSGDPEARSTAMSCAGRALALDPGSAEAAGLVSSLIVEPPAVLPAELVAGLAEEDRRVGTNRLRVSVFALLAVLASGLLAPLMDVRNWTTLGLTYATLLAVTFIVWRAYRRGRPNPWVNLLVGFGLAVAFTRVLGPFVLTPVVIAGSLLPMTANPWLSRRPFVVAAWLLAVIAIPQLLEWLGVFATTWSTVDAGVCAQSAILKGSGNADAFELMTANTVLLATVAAYLVRISRNATDASHRLHVQAWHLGQLLPGSSRRTS